MYEAYAIGVTLKLNNLISPQLALLTKEFEKLDVLVVDFQKSLAKITANTSGLRGITVATEASNKAFERANVSAAAFRNHLASINQTGSAMAYNRNRLPPPGGGSGGGGGGGRPGTGSAFHGGNIHFGAGGIGLGTAGLAAGNWFWPLAVSGAAIYGGKALFESAKDLNSEQNRYRLFGMSEAQNQEAFSYAAGLKIYGTTQIERMRSMREAQGVFRESGLPGSSALAGAKLAAPILAKLDFLASSLDDESSAKLRTANLSMLRYVESSGGLKSASEFNRIADFGYKLNVSSGGTVNWEQLRQFKARAGAAGFHLTDDAMARLEPVIAEMKGGAVGFGLSTAFNRLTGSIRIPNQVAHQLVDQGIWDPHKIVFNNQGGIKSFLGNPLSQKNANLLLTNPELFYETVIRPIYDKLKLSTTDIARENIMLFGTTGGRNMTLIENQLGNIHSSISALTKTKGIDDATKTARESLTGQEKEFDAAWKDFKTQFGTKMLPFFSGVLKAGAAILRVLPTPDGNSVGRAMSSLIPGGDLINSAVDLWNAIPSSNPNRFTGKGGSALTPSVGNVYLDGHKVGAVIDRQTSKTLSRPPTGTGSFDASMGLVPVNMP